MELLNNRLITFCKKVIKRIRFSVSEMNVVLIDKLPDSKP
jgi:hypothetical protein